MQLAAMHLAFGSNALAANISKHPCLQVLFLARLRDARM
jgi:hypothetical protein